MKMLTVNVTCYDADAILCVYKSIVSKNSIFIYIIYWVNICKFHNKIKILLLKAKMTHLDNLSGRFCYFREHIISSIADILKDKKRERVSSTR